jgi:hypothetical protein
LSCWKNSQNTDRIARSAANLAVGVTVGIDRQVMVTDRHIKYRPRIDRLEMNRFAGLSPR